MPDLILRPATEDDSATFFRLRNDPEAISASPPREPITDADHLYWWHTTTDLRLVAEQPACNGEKWTVGVLRVNRLGQVSIILAPLFRGKGYGPRLLCMLHDQMDDLNIPTMTADILYTNTRSQSAFLKAGWRPVKFELRRP